MNQDDWLVRGTAWLALVFYVAGEITGVRGKTFVRVWLTTLGCAALLIHIACAFQYRHNWSESAAYADTARQTAAVTGFNWGGGIYINYLFAAVWVAEVMRSWVRPATGPGGWILFTRAFFLFMFFNAAVVFVMGPIRWFGLLCCLALLSVWTSAFFQKRLPAPGPG